MTCKLLRNTKGGYVCAVCRQLYLTSEDRECPGERKIEALKTARRSKGCGGCGSRIKR